MPTSWAWRRSCGVTCATGASGRTASITTLRPTSRGRRTIWATIKADNVKQKLPENNGGFRAIGFGKTRDEVYTKLTTDHPIDLCRYQVANGYMGRVGLINSGGESHGASDLQEAVMTAVVNKRAGGMGLISGRKAFQRPMDEGIALLNAIQDVYLDPEVTIA